ncbi:keratin-associated protein 13-1 [Cricetulus griseus]|uniref:Keratin-associated protein n=1 Tax=Cricetulus griseus TaxID=10029 RepID=G3GT19_CRIGR|nr:keratin-associated protein 13-1 [Cricetulus griseus]EGW01448.1 Keratin-associated protein 13-1 [Cricetulus griseus]
MAYSCCSAISSSCSQRSCLPSSGSSCGSFYPSNLVYTTRSCYPSICQLGSSLNSGCHETCIEPTSCHRSCVVSIPWQKPWYYPRSFTHCRPCQGTYAACLGFESSSCPSLAYGSRSCYSVGCGPSGFRSLNCSVSGFPSVWYGPRFYYPAYLASTTFQPSCYRSVCGTEF